MTKVRNGVMRDKCRVKLLNYLCHAIQVIFSLRLEQAHLA